MCQKRILHQKRGICLAKRDKPLCCYLKKRMSAIVCQSDDFKREVVLRPQLSLKKDEAVAAQLKALSHNNFPYNDHGIEVVYRFAGFNPWERSSYFGRPLDLGQFERFRRIFYTSCYSPLLGLSQFHFLSSLELSERSWRVRVHVTNEYRREERTYEFTMNQRQGGKYDGVWFCHSLICDGCDDKQIVGII